MEIATGLILTKLKYYCFCTMGIITIAFDDGYADTFDHCAGILADHGITATFAVPAELVGQTLEGRPVMSREQLLALRNCGHEIASHTCGHRNLLEVFDREGEEAVKREMKDSKRLLGKMVNAYIDSMVFPFIESNQNDFLRGLASAYYSSSRITSTENVVNELPVGDPFSVKGVAFTRLKAIEEYNALVDEVAEKDAWLIEVFHLVSDRNTKSAHRDEPYRFFTHIDDFTSHIEHIASKHVPFMTQNQAVRLFGASG